MRLNGYIDSNYVVFLNGKQSKEQLLSRLAGELCALDNIKTPDIVLKALLERESLGSTGIGGGIAIPHTRLSFIDDISILIAVSKEGIDFNTVDKKMVNILFLVLTPDKDMRKHLATLSHLSHVIKTTDFKKRVLESDDRQKVFEILKEEEDKLNG